MWIRPASDASIIVIFGDTIARDLHLKVVRLFHSLRGQGDRRIRNLHPAYASIVVEFDPLLMRHNEATELIERFSAETVEHGSDELRTVEIPVCYDPEFAPDLRDVAQHTALSVEEVISAHASAEYFVYFLGFSPGFAYLGGLPPKLATPRLASPRKSVVEGSVGIAGNQTGVYPVTSPGGWRIIGRTPLPMFQPDANPPTRLQLGDAVTFRAIEREEYNVLTKPSGAEQP